MPVAVRPVPSLAVALSLAGLLALAGASGVADAHEYWLAASSARPSPGDTVRVRSIVGTGFRGDVRPWLRERAVRFERSDADGPIRPDPATAARDSVWLRVPARAAGALVWYESNFIGIELPSDEFDRYLKDEGLDAPLRARAAQGEARGPGRERYRRTCKAWIAGADTAQLAAPRGLPLEIVALGDPGAAGRPLRVRVLAAGQPVEWALVRAWLQPLAADGAPTDPVRRGAVAVAVERRTNAAGEVELPLVGSGEWLLSTVRMVPSARPEEADWESTWASLTFFR